MSDDTAGQSPDGIADSAGRQHAELRTFLIADVRGYTDYTRLNGDAAAAALTRRFAEVVRDAVEQRDGRLLELRGDEGLAVFVSARQALAAAVELQERVAEARLARGVGVGLDAGEAIPVGDGYRGAALNLAARLCGQARAGEILASEAVTHLATRVEGVAYVEQRSLRVKGLRETVRAVRVVREGATYARRRRAPALRAPINRLAAAIAAISVAVVVLILIASGSLSRGTSGSSPAPTGAMPATADSALGAGVSLLDASTGKPITADDRLTRAVEARWDGQKLWVFDLAPPALHRIDPRTADVQQTIGIAFEPGYWLVDGDTIWFTDGEAPTVHRIDAVSGGEAEPYTLPGHSVGGIALTGSSVWVASYRGDTSGVTRLDAATGRVLSQSDTYADDLVAGDEGLWAFIQAGRLTRLDESTGDEEVSVDVGDNLRSVALGGGFVWTLSGDSGLITKLDSTGEKLRTYEVPGAAALSFGGERLWVAGGVQGTVIALDPVTGDWQEYRTGGLVNDVEPHGGSVAVLTERSAEDVEAALTGKVLRLAAPFEPFETTDPALSGGTQRWERDAAEQAMCAKLLNYADVAGSEADTLRPEVATAMPDVSADGRTYSFTIRPGYRFSPPSGEAITAETFRYSIERALSRDLGPDATGVDILSDVVGAAEFHEGRADRVAGIRATGDRLEITLTAPSPTLVTRLALPMFCPVPLGTAAVDGGVNDPPIARSGPFYLSEHVIGRFTVLRRNPNYPGPREPWAEAILWRTNVPIGEAIAAVNSGDLEMTASGEGLEVGGPVDRAWGADSEAAAADEQRYFVSRGLEVWNYALDPRAQLFSDSSVRRAIALAIDRRALAAAWGFPPTDQLVPTPMPGFEDEEMFPLNADIEAARQLMAGRTGRAVLAAFDCGPNCQEQHNTLVENLTAIGIEVEVRLEGDPLAAASEPGNDISVVNLSRGAAYRDPATYLDGFVRGSVPAGWMDGESLADLDRVLTLREPERSRAAYELADRWAAEGRFIAFAEPAVGYYLSARVGCHVAQQAVLGPDLVPLCLEDE